MQGLDGIAAEYDPAQGGGQQYHENRDPHDEKERRQNNDQQDVHGVLCIIGVAGLKESTAE
jgi:hypothetical protein